MPLPNQTSSWLDPSKPLLLIGAGGHAQMLAAWLLEAGMTPEQFYWVDAKAPPPDLDQRACLWHRPCWLEEAVFANPDDYFSQAGAGGIQQALFAIGSVRSARQRWQIAQRWLSFIPLVSWRHPSAVIAQTAEVGLGSVVLAGSVVQPFAKVGALGLLNTGSILEHHASLGVNVHLAPGSVVCGAARIGDHGFIGANAVVKQGLELPPQTTVGANQFYRGDLLAAGSS
jgi:UDP-perosamine 4-acetyltransferase